MPKVPAGQGLQAAAPASENVPCWHAAKGRTERLNAQAQQSLGSSVVRSISASLASKKDTVVVGRRLSPVMVTRVTVESGRSVAFHNSGLGHAVMQSQQLTQAECQDPPVSAAPAMLFAMVMEHGGE